MAVINGYSFLSYCRDNYVGNPDFNDNFVNKDTGEVFSAVIGTLKNPKSDKEKYEFIHISSAIEGGLTMADIIRDKDILRVVELDSGGKILCYPGTNSWKKLDLGL